MIASSYLLYVKDSQILLSRRFQTGYEDGNYSLPAGHVDEGETLTHSLVREVKEEIGVNIAERDAALVHVMHRKAKDIRMDFFFTAKNITGQPRNMEPDRCDDLQWFPVNHLPANTIPYIKRAIQHYQDHIWYSEYGWE